jgi:drug/metabolite transporter (DMT)-like permease
MAGSLDDADSTCDSDAAGGSVAMGLFLGLVSQVLTSLGLCIMKWAHKRNDALPEALRSPMFVVGGFAVNAIGGLFQAIALTMAPQSVISALNPVVLVANCAFAPCLLGEKVTRQDLSGTAAIMLATTVVVVAGAVCEDDFDADQLISLLYRGPHLLFFGFTLTVTGAGYEATRRATAQVRPLPCSAALRVFLLPPVLLL